MELIEPTYNDNFAKKQLSWKIIITITTIIMRYQLQ